MAFISTSLIPQNGIMSKKRTIRMFGSTACVGLQIESNGEGSELA